MAIVSHHTQWMKEYNTDFLLKRPKANLVMYHRRSALHGHPLLQSGAAQFSAPKHLSAAVCSVQRHWLDNKKTPVPALRLWTKGTQSCYFLEVLLPQGTRINNLDDLTTWTTPSY